MKLYPSNTLSKFEFDQLLDLVAEFCVSPMGKERALQLVPFSHFEKIKKELYLTDEFLQMQRLRQNFPTDGFMPVSHFLNLLSKDGFTGEPTHFVSIRTITKAVQQIRKFLARVKEEEETNYPLLNKLVTSVPYEKKIVELISEVLSPEGKVKNNASQVLFIIRQEQQSTQRALEKVFNAALSRYRKMNYLAATQETVRHGRRVLAVKAEYKRKIKGVVHDISESGQTAYIEPNDALQLSNELLNLEQDERAEIHRILKQLTADIRPFVPLISDYETLLGKVDFSRAKAKLANQLDASIPKFENTQVFDLKEAYHPLLKLQNDKANKLTIPLSIQLNKDTRILVISGPNAGGKSVSLKTMGLLQLMLQSGMPVPVNPDSTMGIFSQLLTEIGDEQSIENELSTYSSKLTHMRNFLQNANAKSFFLIDEFGSGTDPNLGGSVAQAILEELNNRKSFGVVTTHYLNLKTFANKAKGIINGAMLFNEETLHPLYKLEVGKPGSSYTFAIAKTSGLPQKVVNRAKNISSNSQVKLDELLTNTQQSQSELVLRQLEFETQKREFELKEKELEQLKKRLKKQRAEYSINKKEEEIRVKNEVKKQFDEYVKQIETLENKQHGAQQIREKLKNELQTTKDVLQKKVRKKAQSQQKIKDKPLEVGDQVRWITNGQVGELLEIKNKKAEVAIGALRTTIPLADLVLAGSKRAQKKAKTKVGQAGTKKPTPENFRFEMDIRGMRFEEAEIKLNDFFDQAILANASWLRVLHGKGSGVLRTLTRNIAKRYNAIEIKHPHFEEGGDGITIVQF